MAVGISVRLRLAVALAAVALAAFASAVAIAEAAGPIRESSGLAASHRAANRLWTHNDSGDAPRLFALERPQPAESEAGGVASRITEVRLAGAEAVDWEDIASGVIDGRATLVVADVGDNGRRRERVTLYVIDEPQIPAAEGARTGGARTGGARTGGARTGGARTEGARTEGAPAGLTVPIRYRLEVRYPDGARDCEAIALDAEQRRVICISKELLPLAGIYSVPLPAAEAVTPGGAGGAGKAAAIRVDAERLGSLPLPMVTGMDIRGDGRQIAVTGYFDLFLFDRAADEPWEVALGRVPKHIPLPKLRQVEAVCFDRQGELWITSEGDPMPLRRIPPAIADGKKNLSVQGHDD